MSVLRRRPSHPTARAVWGDVRRGVGDSGAGAALRWVAGLAIALAAVASPVVAQPALRAAGGHVWATGGAPGCGAGAHLLPDVVEAVRVHGGVVRWEPARGTVRLWVQRRPAAAADMEPDARFRQAVLDGAAGWQGVVPGLVFQPVRDSASADVVVTWTGALDPAAGGTADLAWRTAGRTALAADAAGRAVRAHVQLAVATAEGTRYRADDVRGVARHELGHVLGLAHHAGRGSVMAPLVGAERLTAADRAALRQLYALPTGPLGAPAAGCAAGPSSDR